MVMVKEVHSDILLLTWPTYYHHHLYKSDIGVLIP